LTISLKEEEEEANKCIEEKRREGCDLSRVETIISIFQRKKTEKWDAFPVVKRVE